MVKLSLQFKGFAVGALVHGGVSFMGANGNAVERTVVFVLAMVSALLNGAFDAFICAAIIHNFVPPSQKVHYYIVRFSRFYHGVVGQNGKILPRN